MTQTTRFERPLGVYLVALYFVLAGFLGAIKTHLEWGAPMSFNLFAEHSVWQLMLDIVLHLAVAYLLWHFTSVGRVAALVYGYIHIVMYPSIGIVYLTSDTLLRITPLLGVVFYIESRRFLIRDSPRPATTYEQKTGGADGVKGA